MKKLFLIAFVFASGCAIGSPLEDGPAAEEVTPSGQYIVSVTHLRYKDGMGDVTFAHADVLADKIKSAPGNVGHALRRQIVDRDVWTLSIWTDRESLGNFVASPEHLEAIRDVAPTSEIGRTVNFMVDIEDSPPSWDRALSELEKRGIDR